MKTIRKISTIATSIAIMGIMGASPAIADGHKKSGKFKEADTNSDGMLSRAELQVQQENRLNNLFIQADTNKDGLISKEEMKAHRKNKKPLKNQ